MMNISLALWTRLGRARDALIRLRLWSPNDPDLSRHLRRLANLVDALHVSREFLVVPIEGVGQGVQHIPCGAQEGCGTKAPLTLFDLMALADAHQCPWSGKE